MMLGGRSYLDLKKCSVGTFRFMFFARFVLVFARFVL